MKRLFRTTAFRSALLYACVFSLLSALGLGIVYWSTESHIEGQVDARLRLETDVLLKRYRNEAMPALMETIQRRSDDNHPSIFFYLLQNPNRSLLAGRPPAWIVSMDVQRQYATFRINDSWVRVLATTLPGGYRLLVGRDLNEEKALLAHTFTIVIVAVSVIFLLALSGSFIMGRRALSRIDTINKTAGAFMAGNLGQRLPVSQHGNEFDELSRNLNAMLERIEKLLAGMRQVTDNIAHDLRKPLNRLRSRMEITLLEARSEQEYQAVLAKGIEDADELLKTFNALLSIAQAEAGVKRNDWNLLDLSALIQDLFDLYSAVAEEQDVQFTVSCQENMTLLGNQRLLTQALGNLLDNAVKYTPSGGTIHFSTKQTEQYTEICVADTGPGIPTADRERVLQRFVRLDNARSKPGSGLGLSLVSAVTKLHNGELLLRDNKPGLQVILRFAHVI